MMVSMKKFDDEFMGFLVEMDGEPCSELKNSVEQWRWYQPNHIRIQILYLVSIYLLLSGILPRCMFLVT